METVDQIGIAADAYRASRAGGDAGGDVFLQVGQGEDVHVGGFVGVAGPPMGVHVEDGRSGLVVKQAAPDPLQAGRIVGGGIEGHVPGDGLGPPGVPGLGQLVDDIIDLVDRPSFGLVSEQALVIRVGPLAFLGSDPMVVDAVHHFLAVGLQVFQPAGEGPVDARLSEGVFDGPHHGAVPAGWIPRLVVLGLDRRPAAPAFQDRVLPGLGKIEAAHA